MEIEERLAALRPTGRVRAVVEVGGFVTQVTWAVSMV